MNLSDYMQRAAQNTERSRTAEILAGSQVTPEQAARLRTVIEVAVESFDDATASQCPTLFRRLKQDGSLVSAGTRINWGGTLKQAAADLWDTAENTPDAAPALWEDIAYRDGIRLIPETITAGTAFAKDEQGWWNNEIYTSTIDNNVWTPEQYPSAWEKM